MPEDFWTIICPRVLSHSIMPEKNRPKSFLHWAGCIFFKSLCFQQPISHRNDLITSTKKIKLLFGPLQIVPWGLSQSITGEKKKANFYSSRKRLPFFKKFVYPSTSWVLKKCSYDFHSKCHITLWNLISRSLTFVMSNIARKNRPKSFLWKYYLLFQKFRFQQPLRCYRKGLATSTVKVKIPFGPL